jgi:hypothetical protein
MKQMSEPQMRQETSRKARVGMDSWLEAKFYRNIVK